MAFKFNDAKFDNYKSLMIYINENLRKITKDDMAVEKKAIMRLLESINTFLLKERAAELYDEIIISNLHLYFIDLFRQYSSNGMLEVSRKILSCIITMTDISQKICGEFVNGDLAPLLINETLKVCSDDFKSKLSWNVSQEDVVAQLLSVIHNITRHAEFQQIFIQHENCGLFKGKVRQFLNSKNKRMIILTMCVVTWLTEDDIKDKQLLDMHSNCINNFTDFINYAMKNKDRRYEGWEVSELLAVLCTLSCMGSVKHEVFLGKKCMSTLINILKSKSSLTTEIENTVDILWNLSLTENYKYRLKSECNIENAIQSLVYNTNLSVSNRALLFLNDLSDIPQTKSGKSQTVFDIFVSYCHAQNEIVKKLVVELKKKYKVWIDTEGIKGCGMSDMAKGIEDSKVLLMGVSNSYKQSAYCRSEANWAFRLHKPLIPLIMERKYKPDGWLGMIISSETYINLSDPESLDNSVKQIEEHIKHKC